MSVWVWELATMREITSVSASECVRACECVWECAWMSVSVAVYEWKLSESASECDNWVIVNEGMYVRVNVCGCESAWVCGSVM